MIYAQIKDGIVVNTIVVDEGSDLALFEVGFDALIDITDIDPMPGINHTYDGSFKMPDATIKKLSVDIAYWDGTPSTVAEAIDRIAKTVSLDGQSKIP